VTKTFCCELSTSEWPSLLGPDPNRTYLSDVHTGRGDADDRKKTLLTDLLQIGISK
jgi:hypothetical protein